MVEVLLLLGGSGRRPLALTKSSVQYSASASRIQGVIT
jgi:hypothetical protein